MNEPKDFAVQDPREYYPLKWWQLWRWNPYWECRTYRYRWVRSSAAFFKSSIDWLKSVTHLR